MQKPQYISEIAKAYYGELAGIAFCDMLSERLPPDYPRQSDIKLFGRLEQRTALRLEPLVEKYEIPVPPSEEVRNHVEPMLSDIHGWDELMVMLRNMVPESVKNYDALAAAAEPDDEQALSFLAQHERAVLDMILAEDVQQQERASCTITALIEA